MKTITGKIICAGRLKDNNGDEFHGVMIDTGKEELINKPIPLYQEVQISVRDNENTNYDESPNSW